MDRVNHIVKKRLSLFFLNIVLVSLLIMNFLNNKLYPIILEYGEYQCSNISEKLISLVVNESIIPQIKDEIIVYNNGDVVSIDFNTTILNSIAATTTKKIQMYLQQLEQGFINDEILKKIGVDIEKDKLKKGIVYEIPLSRAFNNSLIPNLGMCIPVRYQIIGEIKTEIVSVVKEYGINNALLEVNLDITVNFRTVIPSLSNQKKDVVSVPLIMKLVQGDVPDSLLGTNILGGI